MDDAFLARFRERSAYETGRDGPPDGFPKLPDLPLGRYTDPDVPGAWRTSSSSVGCGCTPPTTASCRSRAATACASSAGAPILLVRGDDGEVRAFRNACRHRGAPVVRGE